MLLFKKQRILQNNRCEADIAIKTKNKTHVILLKTMKINEQIFYFQKLNVEILKQKIREIFIRKRLKLLARVVKRYIL